MFKYLVAKLIFKIVNSGDYKRLVTQNHFACMPRFKKVGNGINIQDKYSVIGSDYISIGDNFAALYNLRLEAWDSYRGVKHNPQIIIGDNVILNTDVHIGCINSIVIGNNVLIASRVYISDHSHGDINAEELLIAPTARKLVSKGPVIIGDGVWIGEGVCVMPGVTIGENSIIGANAVVTKDIPANSVAAGIPAKVIRRIL